MLIESLIRRIGGTHVTLNANKYHFRPENSKTSEQDVTVPHVCDVKEKKDMARFLSIPEGFAVADRDPDEQVPETLIGSEDFPKSFAIGERNFTLDEIVVLAFDRSGLSVGDWNVQSQDERNDKIESQLDHLDEMNEQAKKSMADLDQQQNGVQDAEYQDPQPADTLDALDRDALVGLHKGVFGRNPNSNWSDAVIISKIKEAQGG